MSQNVQFNHVKLSDTCKNFMHSKIQKTNQAYQNFKVIAGSSSIDLEIITFYKYYYI